MNKKRFFIIGVFALLITIGLFFFSSGVKAATTPSVSMGFWHGHPSIPYCPGETITAYARLKVEYDPPFTFNFNVTETTNSSTKQLYSGAYNTGVQYTKSATGIAQNTPGNYNIKFVEVSNTAPIFSGKFFGTMDVPYSVVNCSCTGSIPTGSTMCSGDNTINDFTDVTSWQYVGTSSSGCTTARKCEYYTPVVNYSCTGSIPPNAEASSAFEEDGLTSNLAWTYALPNTATKCEYKCSAGYYRSGTSCVAYSCTGTLPSGSTMCPSDNIGLTSSLAWQYNGTSSSSCTTTRKCEYYTVPPANNTPTATITAPTGNRSITTGGSISFVGTGTDSDGIITNYEWRQSTCTGTLLSSSASFDRTFTTAGTYTIFFRVRDDDGAWSTNCPSRVITVTDPAVFICTGTLPSGSTMCPSDNIGLTSSLAWQYNGTSSSSCTDTRKCEYYTVPPETFHCVTPTCPDVKDSCGITKEASCFSSLGDSVEESKCDGSCDGNDIFCPCPTETTNWREVSP